jgi:hypothetical protein
MAFGITQASGFGLWASGIMLAAGFGLQASGYVPYNIPEAQSQKPEANARQES